MINEKLHQNFYLFLVCMFFMGSCSNSPNKVGEINLKSSIDEHIISPTKIIVEIKERVPSSSYDLVCDMEIRSSRIEESETISSDNSILFLINFKDSISNAVGKSHNARAMIQEIEYHKKGCGLECVSPKEFNENSKRKNITDRIKIEIDRKRENKDSLFYSFDGQTFFGTKFIYNSAMRSEMIPNEKYFVDKNRPIMLYRESKIQDYVGRTGFIFGYIVYSVENKVNWDKYFNSLKFALWISNPNEEGPKVDDYLF